MEYHHITNNFILRLYMLTLNYINLTLDKPEMQSVESMPSCGSVRDYSHMRKRFL